MSECEKLHRESYFIKCIVIVADVNHCFGKMNLCKEGNGESAIPNG